LDRAGGGNNVAMEAVLRATADGHTLFLANTVNAINATLYSKLNYNFIRDMAPVASLDRELHVISCFSYALEANGLLGASAVSILAQFIEQCFRAPELDFGQF
jgi:hypothetical protein